MTEALVQQAATALARAGLVHAYGHVSARIDVDRFLVCAAGPLGCVGERAAVEVATTGPLPDGVLGEVRAHQAIYRRRPDVAGICRIMPPATMALSTQGIVPLARHGIGAIVGRIALWDDPRLLRDDALADQLAAAIGDGAAIVMRGNGAITIGDRLEKAVTIAWFLEDAARVEERVRAIGGTRALDAGEVVARTGFAGGVVERMWEYLTSPGRIGSYDGGR